MTLNQVEVENELREKFSQQQYRNDLQNVDNGMPKLTRDVLTFFKVRVERDFPFSDFEISLLTKNIVGGQVPIISASIGIKDGLKLADLLLFIEYQKQQQVLVITDVLVTTYDTIYQEQQKIQEKQAQSAGVTVGYVEGCENLHFLDSRYVSWYTNEKIVLLGTTDKIVDTKRKVLVWGDENAEKTPYLSSIKTDEDLLQLSQNREVVVLGDRETRDRFLPLANRVFFLDTVPQSNSGFDEHDWVCVSDQIVYEKNALKFYERKKRR